MNGKDITLEEAKKRATITVNEFACLFNCSTITVYRKVEAGKIQTIKLGSRRLIPNSFFMQLLEEHNKPPTLRGGSAVYNSR